MARPGMGQNLTRSLERENTMHKTMVDALGGSKTADNLNDAAGLGVDPSTLVNLLGGNYMSAAKNASASAISNISGNTPAVREALAKMLVSTDPAISREVSRLAKYYNISQRKAAQILAGSIAGGAQAQGQFGQLR